MKTIPGDVRLIAFEEQVRADAAGTTDPAEGAALDGLDLLAFLLASADGDAGTTSSSIDSDDARTDSYTARTNSSDVERHASGEGADVLAPGHS